MDKVELLKHTEHDYHGYVEKVHSDAEWHGIEPDVMTWEEYARRKGFRLDVETIVYEFSEDSLWGGDDPEAEGIDVQASMEAFEEAMVNHLYDAFGDADVDIEVACRDTERCVVNGDDGHELCAHVEAIADKVWHGDEWLTYEEED